MENHTTMSVPVHHELRSSDSPSPSYLSQERDKTWLTKEPKKPQDPEKIQHIYIMYNDRGSIGQLHVGTREFLNVEFNKESGYTCRDEEFEYDHLQDIIDGKYEYGCYIGSFSPCGYKYLVCLDSDVDYVSLEKRHFDPDSVYYPKGKYWLTNMKPEKFARDFLEVEEIRYKFVKADGIKLKMFVKNGEDMPIIDPTILYYDAWITSFGIACGVRLVWTDNQNFKEFSELDVKPEDRSSFMYFHKLCSIE